MSMPPEMKLQWLEAASIVVQVAIERIEMPAAMDKGELRDCTVTGKIVRAFAGDCNVGEQLSFRVAVYSGSPPPGDCYEEVVSLRAARFIEVYLEKSAGELGLWNARDTWLIEDASQEPILLNSLRRLASMEGLLREQPVSRLSRLRSWLKKTLLFEI